MANDESLGGKVAIVTGAGSGIGRGIATVLARAGAQVVVSDIDENGGRETVEAIGVGAIFARADVTSEPDVEELVATACSSFGGLDVMCNNAGALVPRGSILEIEQKSFDFATALLFRSVFLGLKHAGRVMAEKGSGVIVNTASTAGIQPGAGPMVYGALKAAVIHLTKSAALELGEKGVRVNAICPGGVVTPLVLGSVGAGEDQTEDIEAALSSMRPLKQATSPEDIGQAVLFLAGETGRSITGQALTVDAGESTGVPWSQQGLH